MRFRPFICLTFFLLSLGSQAQDLRVHVNEKGKVGYADSNGNVVIKCQYDTGKQFENGVAIVAKGDKYGIIDTSGKVLLPLKYTKIVDWSDYAYQIVAGKKNGLVDKQGKIIIPVSYSLISKPNCFGKALIAKGGKPQSIDRMVSKKYEGEDVGTRKVKDSYLLNAKYGIINSEGEILIQPAYKTLCEFSANYISESPFMDGGRVINYLHYVNDTLETNCAYLVFNKKLSYSKYGLIDGNGKELIMPGVYSSMMSPFNGMVRCYTESKHKTTGWYYNLETNKAFQVAEYGSDIKTLTKNNVWTLRDFYGDIAAVNNATEWFFVNKNGDKVKNGYKDVRHSIGGSMWAAKNSDGTWAVFDDSGNDISALSGYKDIKFPARDKFPNMKQYRGDMELFTVCKDNKYGCITRNGNVVIPFEYENGEGNCADYIAMKKDGKWGVLGTDNSVQVPFDFENGIILPTTRGEKDFWGVKSDSLNYHYNKEKRSLSSTGYKLVAPFKNGLAYAAPKDMKVEDNPMSRAQLYIVGNNDETIKEKEWKKWANSFGYIVDSEDRLVIDKPVYILLWKDVANVVQSKYEGRLSPSDKKNLLLEYTKNYRAYPMGTTVDNDDWNY